MHAIAAIAVLSLLAGCATTRPVVVTRDVPVSVQIPPSLQTCSEAPQVPATAQRQSTVAHYLVNLWGAWANCSQTLAAVVGAVQAQDASGILDGQKASSP